jgi:membrane associated rhomboid family serine protease
VIALAGAIVAAFALTGQWAPESHEDIYYMLGVISERFYPSNPDHYTNIVQPLAAIFGHPFAHFGWPHILMNMIAYLQSAPFVARRLGGVRFLVLFFFSAIGSALAFILLAPHAGPMAGASGAICGVFGAYFLSVRPKPRAALADPVVRNALLMFVGINVVLFALLPIGIAWQAHLGGFIAGALAYPLLARRRASGPWG